MHLAGPLADASVTFYPDVGRPSHGKTDSDGKFELMYTEDRAGAVLANRKCPNGVASIWRCVAAHGDNVFAAIESCTGAANLEAFTACLEVIEKEGLVENAASVGQYVLQGFKDLQAKYEVIGDVRGRELWLLGTVSPMARRKLEAQGWKIEERAGERLSLR